MEKVIGVVAGAGPFAGLDLLRKILDQTIASTDPEHLTVVSISQPHAIADRTQYLLGQTPHNPAVAIAAQFCSLERMGAQVAAIPCNTAHAPPILDAVLAQMRAANSRLQVLHMIHETAQFIRRRHPAVQRVGLLATTGTWRTNVYPQALEPFGLEVVLPEAGVQKELIHRAIYDASYGIKASGRASATARRYLLKSIEHLRSRGAEAIILGCTELPLAIPEQRISDMSVIDPTFILARALVREANPAKLKP